MKISVGNYVDGFKEMDKHSTVRFELAEGHNVEVCFRTSDRLSIRTPTGVLSVLPEVSNGILIAVKKLGH